MKKIVKREKHKSFVMGGDRWWTFTLECGHKVQRGGYMNGGYSAYSKAEGQQKAKCPVCEA